MSAPSGRSAHPSSLGPVGGLARVVDLDAERRERRPETDPRLTDSQRAVLRRMRSARRKVLTRTS